MNEKQTLRNCISDIAITKCYPTTVEVSPECSQNFVPFNLQLFLCWLIDEDAFIRAPEISNFEKINQKRMFSIRECEIFPRI